MTGAAARVLELHPTVKPVQLVMDALLDCSNRGDIVLDCFLGSGTTLLAAERAEIHASPVARLRSEDGFDPLVRRRELLRSLGGAREVVLKPHGSSIDSRS